MPKTGSSYFVPINVDQIGLKAARGKARVPQCYDSPILEIRPGLFVCGLAFGDRLLRTSGNAAKRRPLIWPMSLTADGEGRTRATANGAKFGRKRKLSDYQRAEATKRRGAGETLAAIAKSYGVAISMISRL
jgi:hypothetical protein